MLYAILRAREMQTEYVQVKQLYYTTISLIVLISVGTRCVDWMRFAHFPSIFPISKYIQFINRYNINGFSKIEACK